MQRYVTHLMAAAATVLAGTAMVAMADPGAYLEVTLHISDANRAKPAAVYSEFKEPFLTTIQGAEQKTLLIRGEDVQVLHGFDTVAHAEAYLTSPLFTHDVVTALTPLLDSAPEVRIYQAN